MIFGNPSLFVTVLFEGRRQTAGFSVYFPASVNCSVRVAILRFTLLKVIDSPSAGCENIITMKDKVLLITNLQSLMTLLFA
jgi:hypothetical protein